MLKSTIAKLVKNSQRAVWGLLLWIPLMALADNTGMDLGIGNNGGGLEIGNNVVGLGIIGNTVPNVVTMLLSLDKSFPALFNLVAGITYLSGLSLVTMAVWRFRKLAEGMSMMGQKDAREPIVHLVTGSLLLFAPSTINTLLVTVFGQNSLLAYIPSASDPAWQLAQNTIIVFVQFVGFIAIVRGLLHLHKSAGGQAQQNAFTKGIVHLVGGVLSMNIVATKNILYSTLGLSS